MDQSQFLLRLSGIQRMEQAFQLSDFLLELAKLNIKTILGKKATQKRISDELQKRLRIGEWTEKLELTNLLNKTK